MGINSHTKMASEAFNTLFGSQLVSKSGVVSTSEALAGKKHVMIYFSAHWCPPCRGFTPVLAEKFAKTAEANSIAVVFVSSDRDQPAFDEYFSEMPWHALPFSERDLKQKLGEKYGVRGIPTLVVLDNEGNLVTKEGRAEVDKYFASDPVAASS